MAASNSSHLGETMAIPTYASWWFNYANEMAYINYGGNNEPESHLIVCRIDGIQLVQSSICHLFDWIEIKLTQI